MGTAGVCPHHPQDSTSLGCTFSQGFGQARGSPLPSLIMFSWSNPLKPQSRRIPLPRSARRRCRCLLPRLIGKRGVGRVSVGDALGCCQEGCNCTEQPGFPGYTLSCSCLQLRSVWISLSWSTVSAEPQPGLFLADLFIWVLHCWRPRLSFCCTCARVHNPGSSRHMGGVSFYPKCPSGIDNSLTEHRGRGWNDWRGPSTGRGNVP